ncbi:hypothetical protein CRG98_018432 [Punica granatum]|uniref:SOSEKI DIX-like domain-containing protein n=1 Tax=Punica granatum TaxID=22663 RepID=A0A2I0JY25_PUNGR|nr:hypothetical protein CRG98_018432 [Punica granatum]
MAATTAKMKKVQVVYYLTRNGLLEHPHFMEVSHFPNLPLRLKDVMDRLTALRGKGMPSMYSWSCKRSYKNGYVWNDLSENDVIRPADGAEYVLKGSEIVESCSGRFQRVDLMDRQIDNPEPHRHSKRSVVAPSEHNEVVYYSSRIFTPKTFILATNCSQVSPRRDEEQEYGGQEEYEEEEKTSYTSSTTPHSRCSRGVSTDELEEPEREHESETQMKRPSHEPPSPPSATPTPSPTLVSDEKQAQSANSSRRFADKDIVDHQDVPRCALGKNSVLLQLISCGSLAKTIPKSTCNNYRSYDLHKEITCRNAEKAVAAEDEAAMIIYMSENPRFGNPQSQEKEYFSGSIVESIRDDHGRSTTESVLKKSNSYNAERLVHEIMEISWIRLNISYGRS